MQDKLTMGAERFIFLGDYTSDCAQPIECMDEMHALEREFPCTFIRGNRDDAQIDCRKNGCTWEETAQSARFIHVTAHPL